MTAFVDVNIVPMDRERVLHHQTVLVRGDRVIAIGPSTRTLAPAGAARVDGRGKYLLPGLADMHTHINKDHGAEELFLHVANGVTTVRDMFGRASTLALRDRVNRGELLGPRIYVVGLPDEACPKEQTLAACLSGIKAAGDLMVKIYWDSQPRFDSIVAMARQLQLPVGGHVSPLVGLGPALEVPYATLEHLWGYFEFMTGARTSLLLDGARGDSTMNALLDTASWMRPGWRLDSRKLEEAATKTRLAGTWNAPTLVIAERICWLPHRDGESPFERALQKVFEVKFPLVKALQNAGAGLLLSTDDVAGFAVHRELELLVQVAGLTPYQALATGTRSVARYLGTEDSTGTIGVGKRADLVLLEGNPLRDIRYTAGPAGVMIGGRWLSRAELDADIDSIVSAGMTADNGRKSHYDDVRRLRQEASLHRGTRIHGWPGDSTPSTVGASPGGDICRQVRMAGR